jgi:hypothetical protein
VQLNYALARWQDPETGRFTSLDPIKVGSNWYIYAACNPLRYKDPTGLKTENTDYYSGWQGNTAPPPPATGNFTIEIPDEPPTPPGYPSGQGEDPNPYKDYKGQTAPPPPPIPLNQDGDDCFGKKIGGTAPPPPPAGYHVGNRSEKPARILQTNPNLSPLGSEACLYRSLQALAEEYVGRNLTPDEINAATAALRQEGVIGDDYYVFNMERVINDAFDRLGHPNTTAVFLGTFDDKNNLPAETDATILQGRTPNGGPHFELGDSEGNLVWDPWYGDPAIGIPLSNERFRAIDIREK